MSLSINALGILDPGIHEATLDEVEFEFGDRTGPGRRTKLIADLRSYYAELQQANLSFAMLLDGSFVMPLVAEPQDIDLIVLLDRSFHSAKSWSPHERELLSRKRVAARYDIDMLAVRNGSANERMWEVFFAQAKLTWCQKFGWPANTQKGLVRLIP